MTALITYIDAWVANDAERITNAVNSDCVIIECYGPRYMGRERVKQWAETRLDAGGIVHRWEVHDHIVTGDRELATLSPARQARTTEQPPAATQTPRPTA